MNQWEREASQAITRTTEQLSLYDRYGSMAYGIILQILPQPKQAQEVLVELFTSPDVRACADHPGNTAMTIIRLARLKALEAKARLNGGSLMQPMEFSTKAKTNLPELVFEMAFRQGYSIELIAEKLHLAKKEVLKAIRDYSVSFRQA